MRPSVSPSVDDTSALADDTYFGFLRGANASDRSVVVDVAEHFVGPAANSAESEDGADQLDSYTRNRSEIARTLPVAADVVVTVVQCPAGCEEGFVGTFDGLAQSFGPGVTETFDYNAMYRGVNGAYWVTVVSGVVIRIDEQYRS